MLTGRYRRLYHFHLKKCGGSTINHWLDTLTSDHRVFNAPPWNVEDTPRLAKSVFHYSDVVHSHHPIRIYVPPNTFCFTVLRDPVQRLMSQVADWRRLNEADTIDSPPGEREYVTDSRRLGLSDFLHKHSRDAGRDLLDNYMTRALAAGRVGYPLTEIADAGHLAEAALYALEQDYDLIGLTEHMDLSRNALCSMAGLPPARRIPTINATRAHLESADILNDLTRVDAVIYARARQLFDQRHRREADTYDTNVFETNHASLLLSEARGELSEGATRYSVRAPIIGSGFHGRDGSGMPSCAVWSGPETCATLFIPTPPNMALSLLVWIRGYVCPSQRDQLRVWIDGAPAAHDFIPTPGYADLLTIDTRSTRDFVRLEIDIGETLGSHDPRHRGFAFDSYGWRPAG